MADGHHLERKLQYLHKGLTILTKFGMVMHLSSPDYLNQYNLVIFKIQDGGQPPWKIKIAMNMLNEKYWN